MNSARCTYLTRVEMSLTLSKKRRWHRPRTTSQSSNPGSALSPQAQNLNHPRQQPSSIGENQMSIQTIGLATLGRDAELRRTPNGEAVTNLSLAFNYGRKDQSGQK